MQQTIRHISAGLENLPTLELSGEARNILDREQANYDQQARNGPLAQDPAFAGRRHETMTVLAALFHFFEDESGSVSGEMMQCAATVTAFLTGQWWAVVYPPPVPVPQEHLDAQRLLDTLRSIHARTGQSCWYKSYWLGCAENFGWTRPRMQAAITCLCASGSASVNPGTIINGKRSITLELQPVFH